LAVILFLSLFALLFAGVIDVSVIQEVTGVPVTQAVFMPSPAPDTWDTSTISLEESGLQLSSNKTSTSVPLSGVIGANIKTFDNVTFYRGNRFHSEYVGDGVALSVTTEIPYIVKEVLIQESMSITESREIVTGYIPADSVLISTSTQEHEIISGDEVGPRRVIEVYHSLHLGSVVGGVGRFEIEYVYKGRGRVFLVIIRCKG